MRQTIKMLNWIIKILWIVTLLLPVTVALSLANLLEGENFGFREPTTSFSDGTFIMVAPFYVNNTGFYDLSSINFTIILRDHDQKIASSSKFLPTIRAGTKTEANYTFSFTLENISMTGKQLLTEDKDLNLSASISFQVAYAITLGVSGEFIMRWYAPFYNLTITEFEYDTITQKFSATVEFDNHAQFAIGGEFLIEIFNGDKSRLLGSTSQVLNAPSGQHFRGSFEITNAFPSYTTPTVLVCFYLNDVSIFEVEAEWS